jgi:peptide/nickel transport system substrate-binding protein
VKAIHPSREGRGQGNLRRPAAKKSASRRRGSVLKRVLIAVAALVVVLVVGGMLMIDVIARKGIEVAGTAVLGVDTSVRSVRIGLISDTSSIKDLTVANPKGYTDPHFMDLGNASLTARVAFLNAIPKSRIIDSVSSRYTAKASGSFVFGSDSPSYKAVVQDNGSNVYPFQDVEKAGELMKSLGADTPVTVRVVFDTDNPRALAEWTLIEARCESAGFTLVSLASADPAEVIESGEFDVFIGTRDLVSTPGADLYSLTGSSFVGFQSDYIDGKLAKLAQAKEGLQQQAILKDVDTELFNVAFGMPLYEVPSMLVVADRVSGFKPSPHASSATWGYFNWSQVSSK